MHFQKWFGIAVAFVVGCGGSEPESQPTDNLASKAEPLPPPPVLPDVPAAGYGNIQGDFMVDRMGQAQYSIPIEAPPGRAGFAPQLSFSYANGAGDGPLGVGWTFGLTSRIARCPTSPAVHRLPRREVRHDGADKFCLDGTPLIALASTGFPATDMVLTPENNPRVRVVGHMNGPDRSVTSWDVDSFEIHYADGRKAFLGRSDSSRIRGIAGRTVEWLTDRVRDADWNVIEYEYSKNTTAFTLPNLSASPPADAGAVLSRVRWGGNAGSTPQPPRFSVKLVYGVQGHLASSVAYAMGQSYWHNRRLDAVQVRVGEQEGTLVAAYKLAYVQSPFTSRSLLESVQRCGYTENPVVESCLTPHKFSYSGTSQSSSNTTLPVIETGSPTLEHLGPLLADVNGDGRSDLVYSLDAHSQTEYRQAIYFRPGVASGSSVFGNETFVAYYMQGSADGTLADFDDNGSLDFMLYAPGCPFGQYGINRAPCGWQLLLMPEHAPYSTTQGATAPLAVHNVELQVSPKDQWVDLDGDSLPDGLLCRIFDDPNDNVAPVELYHVRWNNGGGQFSAPVPVANFDQNGVISFPLVCQATQPSPLLMDVNSDGALDIVRVGPRIIPPSTTPLNRGVLQFATLANRQIHLDQVFSPTLEGKFLGLGSAVATDYNADGLTDVAWYDRDDTGLFKLHILANTGSPSTFFTNPIDTDMHRLALNPPPANAGVLGMAPGAVDFDGDGRSDFFEFDNTRFTIAMARNLFMTGGPRPINPYVAELDIQVPADHGQPEFGDVDGNGMTDVLLPLQFGGLQVIKVAKDRPDQLVGVHAWNNDSIKTIEVSYGQLSDSSVYRRDSSCYELGGTVCINGSQADVVKAVKYDMGPSVARSETTYSYANGRRARGTQRWLGFERVKSTELRSGEITTSTYDLTTREGAWLTRLGMLTNRTVSTPVGSLWRVATESYDYRTFWLGDGFITVQSEHGFAVHERASLAACAAPRDCRALESRWSTMTFFDDEGFPTAIETSKAVSVEETALEYYPSDLTHWILGRVRSERVTDFMPHGIGTKSRYRAWTYRNGSTKVDTYTVREDGDPKQLVTRFDYDGSGNNRSTCTKDVARGDERCTTIEYDAAYALWPVRVTNPERHVTSITMHPRFGQIRQLIDANGEVQNLQFDSLGRVVREVAPDGTSVSYEFAPETAPGPIVGKVIRRSTGNPDVTTGLDRLGRPRTTSWVSYDDPTKRHLVQRDYDAAGMLKEIKGPHYPGAPTPGEPAYPLTQYEYDALDRPKRITRGNGGEVKWSYEAGLGVGDVTRPALGQRVIRTDENGHQHIVETNGAGQVERTVDALGTTTRFTYGAFGLPLSSIDGLQQESVFDYDGYGVRDGMTDPVLGQQSFEVDAFGQVRGITELATGLEVSLSYDRLGRRTRRTAGSEVSTWTYDFSPACGASLACAASEHTIGRLVSSSGPDGDGRRYRFDEFGRLSQQTYLVRSAFHTYEYSYDSAGRLDTLTYPMASDGWRFRAKHEYVNGRLAVVRNAADNNALWTKEDETAAGQTKRVSFGNALASDWRYDREGHVSSIATGALNQMPLASTNYDYDLAGNLIARRDLRQAMTEHFVYDEVDRLRSHCFENGVSPVPPPMPATNDALSRIAQAAADIPETGSNGPTQTAPGPTGAANVSRWAMYSASPVSDPTDAAIAISSRMPMGTNGAVFGAETQYRQCSSYAYDAVGNFEWREGVGAYEYPASTDDGREIHAPSRVVHPSGSTSIKYTSAGRIRRLGGSDFTYGPLGELRSVQVNSGLRSQTAPSLTTFRYDADGIRTEKRTGGAVTTYAGALFEEELSSTGAIPGALTFDANTREARVKLSAEGVVFAQLVHHVGRLQVTAYDGARTPWASSGERPPSLSSAAAERVNGAPYAGSTTIVYLHPDPQGTTETVTDGGKPGVPGRVVERRSYDPFGRLRSPDWSAGMDAPSVGRRNVGFTGHIEDEETGLISMVARQYSPALGRFLTPDTFVPAPLNAQSHNRYAYVYNNPLRYVDPTGYQAVPNTVEMPDEYVTVVRTPRPAPATATAEVEAGDKAKSAAAEVSADVPLRSRQQLQTPGALVQVYRGYAEFMGALNSAIQARARARGNIVHDITGSDILAANTATYFEFVNGVGVGILSLGLLPEAVYNSVGEFDEGLKAVAEGTEQNDPYKAWGGVARMAGAAGTVAGVVAMVAGPKMAAKAGPKGGANPATRAAASRGSTLHADKPGHLPDQLRARYPDTQLEFTKSGVSGQDVRVVGGKHPSAYPASKWPAGVDHADFKPGTATGARTFARDQANKWGEPTHMLPYDPATGKLQ